MKWEQLNSYKTSLVHLQEFEKAAHARELEKEHFPKICSLSKDIVNITIMQVLRLKELPDLAKAEIINMVTQGFSFDEAYQDVMKIFSENKEIKL